MDDFKDLCSMIERTGLPEEAKSVLIQYVKSFTPDLTALEESEVLKELITELEGIRDKL